MIIQLNELVKVSKNCGFTHLLLAIVNAKFNDMEKMQLQRWLQIVEQETQIAINAAKRKIGRY